MIAGNQQKWIGLAQVSPGVDCNLIDGFIRQVASECSLVGLQLESLEDVDDWATRLQHDNPNCAVRSMVDELCSNVPFRFGTFYCFQDEE